MIIANGLSIRPIVDKVKKFAIAVTVEVNISDFCINQNMPFLPGNGIFASAYAATDEKNRCVLINGSFNKIVLGGEVKFKD